MPIFFLNTYSYFAKTRNSFKYLTLFFLPSKESFWIILCLHYWYSFLKKKLLSLSNLFTVWSWSCRSKGTSYIYLLSKLAMHYSSGYFWPPQIWREGEYSGQVHLFFRVVNKFFFVLLPYPRLLQHSIWWWLCNSRKCCQFIRCLRLLLEQFKSWNWSNGKFWFLLAKYLDSTFIQSCIRLRFQKLLNLSNLINAKLRGERCTNWKIDTLLLDEKQQTDQLCV